MSEVSSAGRLGFLAAPEVGGAQGVAELARVRGTDALGSMDSNTFSVQVTIISCVYVFRLLNECLRSDEYRLMLHLNCQDIYPVT